MESLPPLDARCSAVDPSLVLASLSAPKCWMRSSTVESWLFLDARCSAVHPSLVLASLPMLKRSMRSCTMESLPPLGCKMQCRRPIVGFGMFICTEMLDEKLNGGVVVVP
jgi:hypothetical protein